MKPEIKRADLVYPEESYKIVGAAFDVYNILGPGHHEKYYQRALSKEFKKREIKFQEQVYYPLKYREEVIGKQYFDFLVEGKVVVELKKGNNFSHRHIKQVFEYLKSGGFLLAILVNFGQNGVVFKRIINII